MAVVEINWNPSPRQLRQFAGIWLPAFFIVVGALVLGKSRSLPAAAAVWAAGFALSLVGYLVPAFMRLVYVGWMCAGYPIGWVISHLVLAGIYYLVFTPVGLVMRWCGRDPMQRTFDRSASTYWVPHKPPADASRYFRQF